MTEPVARLREALADRYVVRHEVGRGGMATVYLADDRRHERRVAIKILNPELASAVGAERFLREIRVTAQLDHPHILPLLDSGEAAGLLYYVMPFVEGETLQDRLSRDKQLPIDEAIRIVREMADALGHAHSLGIVHRDIKPGNVLLAGGHARVADFGIARAVTGASHATLTDAGLAIGTPAYMSPEQAEGDQDVDVRSDQYSLGCVLYEMLAGEVPHHGASAVAILGRRLSEPAPSVSAMRAAVPAGVEAALARALARTPADRFPTVGAFVEQFDRPAPASAGPTRGPIGSAWLGWGWRPLVRLAGGIAVIVGLVALVVWRLGDPPLDPGRVVVVPFDDHTGDPSLEGLGELVAEWVTGELARSGVALVVPSSSVRAHTRFGTVGAASAIALLPRTVGAGTVISGVLRVTDGRIQAEVEIIDVRSGRLLDALEPVRAPVDSTRALIAITAQRIVAAVALRLNPEFQWARATTVPPSLDAFREFEAGMALLGQGQFPEALGRLYRAHSMDSTYLAPLLPAAAVHVMLGQRGVAESLLVSLGPHQQVLTPVDRDHREWLFAWIYGDVERGYRAAEALFAAAPETFAYQLGLSGVRTNRPSRAVEAFPHADLEAPWMKAWTLYWTYYADAYHMLGQLQDARVVAVRGRQLHPGSLALLRDEILVNAALGQVRDVDSLLEGAVSMRDAAGHWFALTASSAALEYRAHGHQQAAEVLFARVRGSLEMGIPQGAEAAHEFTVARVAYWSGRWHDALPVFERLVREDSSSVERLGFLGASYARADRRNEALALSEQLRALEQPYSLGLNTLWRARIAAVLGDQAQAVQLLGLAIREGQAYGIWLHREPDFEGLRAFAPFEAMIRPRPGASGATPP